MGDRLQLISAGAAQGLVQSLQGEFQSATGATIEARFGAVGAMKEALLGGAPCDLMITTGAMIDELAAAGWLDGSERAPLGWVATGIGVPQGSPLPDVSSADALRAALKAADEIYFPDPTRATAGIHFAGVMRRLGIHDELQPRFRTYPNGAAAMRAMAERGAPRLIGCTQLTEILYTAGVAAVAALPAGLGLETLYAAALSSRAAAPQLARRLLATLSAPETSALRESAGFAAPDRGRSA